MAATIVHNRILLDVSLVGSKSHNDAPRAYFLENIVRNFLLFVHNTFSIQIFRRSYLRPKEIFFPARALTVYRRYLTHAEKPSDHSLTEIMCKSKILINCLWCTYLPNAIWLQDIEHSFLRLQPCQCVVFGEHPVPYIAITHSKAIQENIIHPSNPVIFQYSCTLLRVEPRYFPRVRWRPLTSFSIKSVGWNCNKYCSLLVLWKVTRETYARLTRIVSATTIISNYW